LSKPKDASEQEINAMTALRPSSAQDRWKTPDEWRGWRATGAHRRDSVREYARKVVGHLWTVIVAVAAGLIGIVESLDNNLKVPVWIWLMVFALGLVYAQFQAFHDIRVERDSLLEDEAKRLARISRLFGTELREIRRKIEMAKAMAPTPHYSHDFQLPGARWDEYDETLAAFPELYDVVGRAYTAAHQVNEALGFRRTRASSSSTTLGVIPDDGLNAAYDAAGQALDALGEPRGEVWETAADRATRLLAEDVLNELEATD
jgi:hypothetical protein